MLACFAWTNLQLINISNAKVNLYKDEKADLFVRMGPHISKDLLEEIRSSNIYEHVYPFDPVVLSYRNMRLGWIPGFKVLLLKGEFQRAYDALLSRLCGDRQYHRALVTWFYAENVFVLNYWKRHTDHLAITLVEEGTGSYFYSKKELSFPMFMGKYWKDRLRRKLTEGPLARKLAKSIDSICLYKPKYCRPDVDYRKLCLPQIREDSNPRIYRLLCGAAQANTASRIGRYDDCRGIYFSLFTQNGPEYDATSLQILTTMVDLLPAQSVVAKIHTGDPVHAETFAREIEDRAYVDRGVYIFEGLYVQLHHPEQKLLVSCISSAAINPKFIFDDEPYVIFTYRLYDDYQTRPIKGDDWVAEALKDAYEDKSRVMIPNSMEELEDMLKRIRRQ